MGSQISISKTSRGTRERVLLIVQECWKELQLPQELAKIVASYISVSPKNEIKEAFQHDPDRARGLAELIPANDRSENGQLLLENLFATLPVLQNVPLAVWICRRWNLNGSSLLCAMMHAGMWNDEMQQWKTKILEPAGIYLADDHSTTLLISHYNHRPWLECKLSRERRWKLSRESVIFTCGCVCPLVKCCCETYAERPRHKFKGGGYYSCGPSSRKCALHR